MRRAQGFGSLIVLALTGSSPGIALAQSVTPAASVADATVNIDIDNADVVTTLKQLFKQAQVSYVIDSAVKSKPFSAGLHSVPLRTALETLLSDSGESVTYSVDNGIYNIYSRERADSGYPSTGTEKFGMIRPNNSNAAWMLPQLVAVNPFGSDSHLKFSTPVGNNVLLVSYPDTAYGEEMFRQVQTLARFTDIQPKAIEFQVRIECDGESKTTQQLKPVITLMGRTTDKNTAHFKMTSGGSQTISSRIAVDTCTLDINIKPAINGNNTLSLNASGTLNLSFRLPGESNVRRLQSNISYDGNQNYGDSVVVNSLTMAQTNKSGSTQNVLVRVVVTSRVLPDVLPGQP